MIRDAHALPAAASPCGPDALPTVAAALRAAETRLRAAGVDTPRRDAELLAGAVTGWTPAALAARMREPLPPRASAALEAAVARRCRREPLQYIVGRAGFWSLDLEVTPDVLIPRPETEVLVDVVLRRLDRQCRGRAVTVCDVGTGSGCVALALAAERPDAAIWAVDRSLAALGVAAANARRCGAAGRVRLVASDLLAGVAGLRADAVVANLPYVRTADLAALQPELAWEPRAALDGGPTGLALIERLLRTAGPHLVSGGFLALEIGWDQDREAAALATAAGWRAVEVLPDLAGRPRVLVAER